jgi:ATPase family associated with various cellular activities (AAA)
MDHALEDSLNGYGGGASQDRMWHGKPRSEESPSDRLLDRVPDQTTKFRVDSEPTQSVRSKQAENERHVEGIRQLWTERAMPKDSAEKDKGSSIVTIKRLTISDDQSTGSASRGRILSALRPRDHKLRATHQNRTGATLRSMGPPPISDPLDLSQQLLLLEQSNKKRLAMARLESLDEAPRPQDDKLRATHQESGESCTTASYRTGAPLCSKRPPPNFDPMEYQQLLFLEQQNKKRLKMARRESLDTEPNLCHDEAFSGSLPPSHGLPPGAQGLQHAGDTLGFSASPKDDEFASYETSSVNLEDIASGTEKEESLIPGTPDSEALDLQKYILDLEKKAKAFDDLQKLREPRRHQVLYRLYRGDNISTYFDHPTWVVGHKRHMLRSSLPLTSLSSYLEKHCDLAFIVYKDFDVDELEAAKSKAMSDESSEDDMILEVRNTHESILPVSRDLCAAVSALLGSRSDFSELFHWYQTQSLIPGPYLAIYHSRSAMNEFIQTLAQGCQKQLGLLLDYVFSQFGDEYAAADDLLARGRISLPYLKYLYKPNDVLVEFKDGDCLGFVSKSWPLNTRLREPSDEKYHPSVYSDPHTFKGATRPECRICEIEGWSWRFDGTFSRRNVLSTLELDFNDKVEKDIADLNIRPMKYVSDEVRDLLKRRGETFWSCRFRRFVSYKETEGRDWQASSDERYMIDLKTYHELHSEGTSASDSRRIMLGAPGETVLSAECLKEDTPPGDNFIFLVPLTIKGYNLRRKKWVDLRADRITPVTWNKEAFQNLVLDRKTKDLIQALISNQLDAEKSTDLIRGKGNGLILLLHGGPGTGKTLTAESVAEMAEKPLYRVTCGDIGTEGDEVEKYLESVLNLGKIWGCVVLLDEADVFLEQRSLEDLVRNALVSVFLRVLEYYDGILVLTSNRVGTFDEAFKSRIQLALHYPNLGPFQRMKIWENFILRLEGLGEDMIDFDGLKDHLEELARHKMNGRQIRNAITTARQYAQWKKAVLTYSHLKDVIEISGRFDLYLDKLNGGYTQDQLAEDEGLRLSQAP